MTPDTPETHRADETAPTTASVPETLPSPGAMIREARERMHLSLDDMAAHTKLARPTLDALERDDYHALLEPVYVRGYYRKCAKVLEMDEAGLIAAYESRVSPRLPEAPSKLRLASGTELGSSSRLPVAMAIVFAIAAVVVPALLWLTRDRQEAYPTAPVIAPVEVAPQTPATPEPGATLPDDVTPDSQAAVAPVDEPPPAGQGAAEPEPTAAAALAPGTLNMRFVEASWVRVDDAGGKVLLNQTEAAGSVRTVQGQAPLNVFLGNAPGVELQYEGQPVDVSGHVRDNNTARFTLPQR